MLVSTTEVLRAKHGTTSRYWTCVPGTDTPSQTTYDWPQQLDRRSERELTQLLRTVADDDRSSAEEASHAAATQQYVEELRRELLANRCRLLTIRRDGALLGAIDLRRNCDADKTHLAEINGLFIAARGRRTQLVAAAFYEIARYCQHEGIESLTVMTGTGIATRRFCQRFGFQVYATLPGYTRVKGRLLPGYRMQHSVRGLQNRADALLWKKHERSAEVA